MRCETRVKVSRRLLGAWDERSGASNGRQRSCRGTAWLERTGKLSSTFQYSEKIPFLRPMSVSTFFLCHRESPEKNFDIDVFTQTLWCNSTNGKSRRSYRARAFPPHERERIRRADWINNFTSANSINQRCDNRQKDTIDANVGFRSTKHILKISSVKFMWLLMRQRSYLIERQDGRGILYMSPVQIYISGRN